MSYFQIQGRYDCTENDVVLTRAVDHLEAESSSDRGTLNQCPLFLVKQTGPNVRYSPKSGH